MREGPCWERGSPPLQAHPSRGAQRPSPELHGGKALTRQNAPSPRQPTSLAQSALASFWIGAPCLSLSLFWSSVTPLSLWQWPTHQITPISTTVFPGPACPFCPRPLISFTAELQLLCTWVLRSSSPSQPSGLPLITLEASVHPRGPRRPQALPAHAGVHPVCILTSEPCSAKRCPWGAYLQMGGGRQRAKHG